MSTSTDVRGALVVGCQDPDVGNDADATAPLKQPSNQESTGTQISPRPARPPRLARPSRPERPPPPVNRSPHSNKRPQCQRPERPPPPCLLNHSPIPLDHSVRPERPPRPNRARPDRPAVPPSLATKRPKPPATERPQPSATERPRPRVPRRPHQNESTSKQPRPPDHQSLVDCSKSLIDHPATEPVTQPGIRPATRPVNQPATTPRPTTRPATRPADRSRHTQHPQPPQKSLGERFKSFLGKHDIVIVDGKEWECMKHGTENQEMVWLCRSCVQDRTTVRGRNSAVGGHTCTTRERDTETSTLEESLAWLDLSQVLFKFAGLK